MRQSIDLACLFSDDAAAATVYPLIVIMLRFKKDKM